MNVLLNKYAAVGHSCVDLKMEVYYLNRQNKSSFLKMANLLNVSLKTICLHLPDPCMADARGIGSVCAEYRRVFMRAVCGVMKAVEEQLRLAHRVGRDRNSPKPFCLGPSFCPI